MFETFSNCELNVPLLKLVEGVPRFAKFLKELCTIKRNQKEHSKKKSKAKETIAVVEDEQMPKNAKTLEYS